MPKGITYSFTDDQGRAHSRFSARQLEPIYTHAAVHPDVGRDPSYSTSPAGAIRNLGRAWENGAKAYPVTATPGRIAKRAAAA